MLNPNMAAFLGRAGVRVKDAYKYKAFGCFPVAVAVAVSG